MATVNARQFRRIQTTDKNLNLIQDQLQDLFKQIAANPWVFGKPLPQVSFAQGINQVQHGLGRNYVSFFAGVPIAVTGGFLVIAAVQQDRSQYVSVVSSHAVVCDCFVF